VNELSDDELAAFQEVAKTKWAVLVDEIGADYANKVLDALGLSI